MAYVTLHYGPYFFMNVLDFRTNRLTGLIDRFVAAGVKVYLRRSNHFNRLSVEVFGKIVFTCRITYLAYSGDGGDYCSDLAFNSVMDLFKRIYPDCFTCTRLSCTCLGCPSQVWLEDFSCEQ